MWKSIRGTNHSAPDPNQFFCSFRRKFRSLIYYPQNIITNWYLQEEKSNMMKSDPYPYLHHYQLPVCTIPTHILYYPYFSKHHPDLFALWNTPVHIIFKLHCTWYVLMCSWFPISIYQSVLHTCYNPYIFLTTLYIIYPHIFVVFSLSQSFQSPILP